MNNTWEQPYKMNDKTEPVQSFEAFKIWVEMGNKRSLKAVAERLEKSHDTIKKYSCTWKWSERLNDKLTYENKTIHAKQLEAVMTGLNVDETREIILQTVLGNILQGIMELSCDNTTNLCPTETIRPDGTIKVHQNPRLQTLERLTKIYSELEAVHTKNQQKLIDFNNRCLTVQSFNDPKTYDEMLKHGTKQYLDILEKFLIKISDEEHNYNFGGQYILTSQKYNPYSTQQTEQLEAEETEPKQLSQ